MRLQFNEYNEAITNHFGDEAKLATFAKMCVETYKGKAVQGYSVAEANECIRQTIIKMCGLSEKPTPIEIKKAMRKESVREVIFEIITETVMDTVVTGWNGNPFFRKYVEFKNLALGDTNEFYMKDNCYLTVAEIADGHHSLERQRLGKGRVSHVSVKSYGVKVYMEMSRFLQGVEDWAELISKISEAITEKVNSLIYDAVMSAAADLPVADRWNQRGEINPTNKARFMTLVRDVARATGSSVEVFGTSTALATLTDMFDVAWLSNDMKDTIYNTGNVGRLPGGINLVEIPQTFERDNVQEYQVADDVLLILPTNIGTLVAMVWEGADEIYEVTDPTMHNDQSRDYEYKTRFGIASKVSTRFGKWTIGA